jgi:16S rRNA (cytosine967-C5)-methyltransferase
MAHSVPQWIAELWWEELGPEAARSTLAAINRPAETALRVNLLRTDREAALARLGEGFAPPPPSPVASPEAIVAAGPLGEEATAMLAEGALVAQSRASQAVVSWLDPQPGDRVLDLCAGPGVKTTQIAARLRGRGEIVSIERDPRRGAQIEDLCARTAATGVAVEVADATEADLGAGYDRVLVDPPCTDLGALASRPDARWRKRAEQPARLAEIQGPILRRGLAVLRPGGTLVYSTCTISAREGEQVVAQALADEPGLAADDLGGLAPGLASRHDPRFLQTRPDRDGTDGFFVARIRREERG